MNPRARDVETGNGGAPLLEVRGLRTQFAVKKGVVHAVDGVSFSIGSGEMLGVVGESGCGKSVTGLSIMRLVPYPGRVTEGEILFRGTAGSGGRDLLAAGESEMRLIRGSSIAMIFQDPMTSLNPVLTVSRQLTEAIRAHTDAGAREAKDRAVQLLRTVGIPSPEKRIGDYPHQFSGGMRQRVMIAMAISCSPRILIADEPTTALDVTIQAQILELMRSICEELGTSIMLITHALGIVAGMCRRVAVMYAGRMVEQAGTRGIFSDPRHPYTRGLLTSTPRMDRVEKRLQPIRGFPPSLLDPPARCLFSPRCAWAVERCWHEEPALEAVVPGHLAACFRSGEKLW
jgi:oligopeptide transport system ATP-binding protein